MLNELYQALVALEKRGVPLSMRHSALDPMPKGDLLLIRLADDGRIAAVEVVPKEEAGLLMRVQHGSSGSAFPGFNLPGPLRTLSGTDNEKKERGEELSRQLKRRNATVSELKSLIRIFFGNSESNEFTNKQEAQFKKSVEELTGWLRDDLANAGEQLANFKKLVQVVLDSKLTLDNFAKALSEKLTDFDGTDYEAPTLKLFAKALFQLDKIPVYLELHEEDESQLPASDPRTGNNLNEHMLSLAPLPYLAEPRNSPATGGARRFTDSITGKPCNIPDKFPKPKVAHLGNVTLFSNNTAESKGFFRYGLGASETFPVSEKLANRMAGALLTLASEDRLGKTCRGIQKSEILLVYLEEDPVADDPFVELFGGESKSFSDADYAALAAPLIVALDGRAQANPSQLLRVIGLTSVDKANTQISLHRSYTAAEVLKAAQDWTQGAKNAPPVTLTFHDKQAKSNVAISRATPAPMDVLASANRLWQLDGKYSPAPILRHGDAFDLLLNAPEIGMMKTEFVLNLVLTRQRPLFVRAGQFKQSKDFKLLPDYARWQVLKSVGLLGILLCKLNRKLDTYMKDTNYQVGRLLSLADSLHYQYCKLHRTSEEKRRAGKVDTPTHLLGNALFGTALENPVRALSLLAQRIRPYHGWGKTYGGENAKLVRWFIRQMGDCEKSIDFEALGKQGRPQDVHKAELLLGYLADQSATKDENNNPEQG